MWRSAVQLCLGLREVSEELGVRSEELRVESWKILSKLSTLNSELSKNGGLAQLARAPALQAGGQRFESVILHHEEWKNQGKEELRSSIFQLFSSSIFFKRSLTY